MSANLTGVHSPASLEGLPGTEFLIQRLAHDSADALPGVSGDPDDVRLAYAVHRGPHDVPRQFHAALLCERGCAPVCLRLGDQSLGAVFLVHAPKYAAYPPGHAMEPTG